MRILCALLPLFACVLCAASAPDSQSASFKAPSRYVGGHPYTVSIEVAAADDGSFDSALLGPWAFTLDGKPLARAAKSQKLQLAPGARLTVEFDLGPDIQKLGPRKGGSFVLALAGSTDAAEPQTVSVFEAAPKDLDFMTVDVNELARFQVLMQTVHGDMLFEFWPDVAPDHVRNFLDLASSGFYDGTIFHRVSPGFMIQGGDPTGTGKGNGPRTVMAEFNDREHVRGVLSMARSMSVDSASCQFFVMHGRAPALDNQYSAFGKLVKGEEVLDEIATARGATNPDRTLRPFEPQKIVRAIAIVAPGQDGDAGGSEDDE